jgi:hypothetical protein
MNLTELFFLAQFLTPITLQVEILQMVVDGLKEKGLESVTLSDMKKLAGVKDD